MIEQAAKPNPSALYCLEFRQRNRKKPATAAASLYFRAMRDLINANSIRAALSAMHDTIYPKAQTGR